MHPFALKPILDIRPCPGIGDLLSFSRFPELYHGLFHQKLQVLSYDQYGLFGTNPYCRLVAPADCTDYADYIQCPWLEPRRPEECDYTVMNPVYQATRHHFPDAPINLKPRVDVHAGADAGPTVCFVSEGSTTELPNQARVIPRVILEPLLAVLGRQVRVVNLGSPANYRPAGQYMDLAGQTTILDVARWLAAPTTAFICVNSGPMHIANALVPAHRIFVYMKCDVPVPLPTARSITDLADNRWLYEDNTFFGPRADLVNVIHHEDIATKVLASLEGSCIPSR